MTQIDRNSYCTNLGAERRYLSVNIQLFMVIYFLLLLAAVVMTIMQINNITVL